MAVQFKFTGDDKDVQRALERMEKQYNALIATTKKGTDETKKMAAEAKKAFEDTRTPLERWAKKMQELNALVKQGAIDQETFTRAAKKAGQELEKTNKPANGLVQSALQAASGYLSVAAALGLVNAALSDKIALEKASSDKQQEMANKQREALINLGTATKQERSEILGGLAGISKRTGVKQGDLMAALPGLTSAQGALSTPQMMSALEMAARVAPHNAETMGELALGLENTASLTGSKDMQENMGFQLGIGRGTQIKNLGDINKYLIRGAIGVKGFGGSATDAAAIVSTLTSTMKDTEGRLSQTAGISLAQQLAEFMPEKDRFTTDERGRKKLEARGTGLTDTASRIAAMQSDANLRDQFMAKASFEHQAFIPIQQMLTGGTEGAGILESRKKDIQLGAAAKATAADFMATVENEPMQQGAASVRKGESVVEEMLLNNEDAARKDRARNLMVNALWASGEYLPGRLESRLMFEASGRDPEESAIAQLERRRGRVKGWSGESKREVDTIAGIDEVIAELKKISSQQRNRNPELHAE